MRFRRAGTDDEGRVRRDDPRLRTAGYDGCATRAGDKSFRAVGANPSFVQATAFAGWRTGIRRLPCGQGLAFRRTYRDYRKPAWAANPEPRVGSLAVVPSEEMTRLWVTRSSDLLSNRNDLASCPRDEPNDGAAGISPGSPPANL